MAVILTQEGSGAASRDVIHGLQGTGHTLVLARNGWEVVEKLRHAPDILLIDLRLPDWQHRLLLRAAIETADARRIPVVVLTDDIARTADLLGDGERGVAHILLSPITPGWLEDVVEAVLNRHIRWHLDSLGKRRSGPPGLRLERLLPRH